MSDSTSQPSQPAEPPPAFPPPPEFTVGASAVPAPPPFPAAETPAFPAPDPAFAAPDPAYTASASPYPLASAAPPVSATPSSYPTTGYPVPAQPSYGGYGGYGGGYYPAYVPQPKSNGLAIGSMVTSIVGAGLLFCYGAGLPLGIVGAILGHVARRQIRTRGEGGDGMALAGIIVGWIVTGLGIVGLALIVWFFAWVATLPTPDGAPVD